MAVGLLSEFLCRSRGIIKGVRLHKFSLSGSPRFGLSALKTLLCGFDFDVIACRQEPEWVDPVPSIPLSEAQLLRESTIEPPPSIRQPQHSPEDPERTPHRNLGPFRQQQGNAYASPFLREPGLLDRTIQRTGWNVNVRLSCNRHGSLLCRMMKLAVTPFILT